MGYKDRHQEYLAWKAKNPNVYQLFVQFALQMATRRRFGIGLITERVRWEMAFQYPSADFKINNNFRAYIACDLIDDHPNLAGKLELRRVRYGPQATP